MIATAQLVPPPSTAANFIVTRVNLLNPTLQLTIPKTATMNEVLTKTNAQTNRKKQKATKHTRAKILKKKQK
jgi:hypothetical protein